MSRAQVRVKICGLTTQADALEAIRLGAHALGFNAWPRSTRYIDPATPWIQHLPPFVTRVAILVNHPLAEAMRIGRLVGIDALQLHGDESPDYCARLLAEGFSCIKAFRLPAADGGIPAHAYPAMPVLLDAAVAGTYGGTGTVIEQSEVERFIAAHPERHIILSGGLTPDNVDRIKNVDAIDLASGVESSPGIKCSAKMACLFAALRSLQEQD